MKNCYNCGKMLLGKKVLGQIGSSMYYFCSEKCRSITWHTIGVKSDDSMDFTSKDIDEPSMPRAEKKEEGAKQGSASTLILEGAEYSYSARTNRVTIKIQSLKNKSGSKTGSLRFELFMSKSGPYKKGESVSGFTLGRSSVYEPLRVNSAYSNISSTNLSTGQQKSGTYQPIIFVRELNEDGTWKVAAFANFPNKEKLS